MVSGYSLAQHSRSSLACPCCLASFLRAPFLTVSMRATQNSAFVSAEAALCVNMLLPHPQHSRPTLDSTSKLCSVASPLGCLLDSLSQPQCREERWVQRNKEAGMGGFARNSRQPFSLLTAEATLVQASQEGSWRPQPFREAQPPHGTGHG